MSVGVQCTFPLPATSSLSVMFTLSSTVADDLEASDHLPNAKEANGFGGNDAGTKQRIAVQIPYSGEETLWTATGGVGNTRSGALELGGVADGFRDGSEIALYRLDGAEAVSARTSDGSEM